MCLTSSSLDSWIANNPDNPHVDIVVKALPIFSELWPNLDHNVKYCLNPLIVAAELLENNGLGTYPKIKRFTGKHGDYYKQSISLMVQALQPKSCIRSE
jgi:hypothetical protein